MQMTDSKILFDDIPDLGDLFISLHLKFDQFRRGKVFAHDSVGDVIVCQKLFIGRACVPFIGIHLIKVVWNAGCKPYNTEGNWHRLPKL